ncbi:MAG: hypothetical protein JRI68_19555 [Deltaproteobacteria bacterium]|nr:hypothetical protein [Deltaproteobacteria bacterium]
MRSSASMLLAASCVLLLASSANANQGQPTGQASTARQPAAIQRVELEPITARPLKPQAAIEVAPRRLSKGQTWRKRRFVQRIGQRLHRRPL